MGISYLTGKMYKNCKATAISDHALISEHYPDFESFSILSKERSRLAFKLLIKESLFIFRDKPALNKTRRSYPLLYIIFNDN